MKLHSLLNPSYPAVYELAAHIDPIFECCFFSHIDSDKLLKNTSKRKKAHFFCIDKSFINSWWFVCLFFPIIIEVFSNCKIP